MQQKTKLSRRFWTALVLFGLMGQIAWVVENMYLNVFIYKMFAASAADISLMVSASAVAATVTTVFMGALIGACLGFLWFNAYPAQVFMGDTSSLFLGGVIGTAALCVKQELLLPIAGGIFVLETLSVMLQMGYFKLTRGKRLFKMAPIHHHFELLGVPEPKVIVRFWIVGIMLMLLSLASLKIR